MTHRSNIMSAT